ncbi:MAG TPA: hypothetical protein VMU95_32165 [Trebonia sp.]|nr:hypothetical protein [Trebonia sp.]
MFRSEMSSQARPSLDGLAQEVLAGGRRARRARTAKIASTVLVAAGLAGAVVAVAVPKATGSHPAASDRTAVSKSAGPVDQTRTAPAGSASTVPAAAILTTVNSPVAYIPQPAGPKAPTTSAAILGELLKLLPPGATSNYAFYGGGAQTYLDGPSGVGMIRIFLFRGSLNPGACTGAVPSDMTRTCTTLPTGATVLTTRISDNCVEPLAIDVDHGNGTVVQINVASCLAWNGTSNPPSPMAITAAQAEQIAANPAWGALQMDAAVVHAAASRFAGIPGSTSAGSYATGTRAATGASASTGTTASVGS